MFGQKKNHIQNLVRGKTRDGPKKIQLTTEMKPLKPKVDQNSQETITIFNNSDCVHQFTFSGISDDDFHRLIGFAYLSIAC